MSEFSGFGCFWSDLSKHPTCPHGPTLLFGKYTNGELKQFYACSACRDRKLCTFYAEKDAKFTEAQIKAWKSETKKMIASYNHRKLYIRFNQSMIQSPDMRAYCHTCETLILSSERSLHTNHDIQIGLSDEEMNNPTTILKPLSNVKKEAQYLFSKKATVEITDLLVKAGAKQVLCIGAPKIHEHIMKNFEHKISSLLLDFDGRFHNFFGPLNYCWYNLFNHHFFGNEGAETFREFMTQNNGQDTFVICDPPFGGRVEAISQTMKVIVDQHKKWNNIAIDDKGLNIIFVFPYFMESIIREKSNPPGIEGGLKDLKMSDYKVDYENHPLFITGSKGRKHGSPVRIFTNIDLQLLELPVVDGYKYCGKCLKWISPENKHCNKCKSCTSKDGRRYKHCDICRRCVKPTWKHCSVCERCTLEQHKCGMKPKINGQCFVCGGQNHTGKNCHEINNSVHTAPSKTTCKQRKNDSEGNGIVTKKGKSVQSEAQTHGVETTKLKKQKAKNLRVKGKKNVGIKKTRNVSIGKIDGKSMQTEKLEKSEVKKTNKRARVDGTMKLVEKGVKRRKPEQKKRDHIVK